MDQKDLNNFNIKICDFGFSCKYDPQKGMSQPLGSPLYMSPQMLTCDKYTSKSDIWSIGVTAHELLSGKMPFEAQNLKELIYLVRHEEVDFDDECFDNVSERAKQFIRACLNKDEAQRPTA